MDPKDIKFHNGTGDQKIWLEAAREAATRAKDSHVRPLFWRAGVDVIRAFDQDKACERHRLGNLEVFPMESEGLALICTPYLP